MRIQSDINELNWSELNWNATSVVWHRQ